MVRDTNIKNAALEAAFEVLRKARPTLGVRDSGGSNFGDLVVVVQWDSTKVTRAELDGALKTVTAHLDLIEICRTVMAQNRRNDSA